MSRARDQRDPAAQFHGHLTRRDATRAPRRGLPAARATPRARASSRASAAPSGAPCQSDPPLRTSSNSLASASRRCASSQLWLGCRTSSAVEARHRPAAQRGRACRVIRGAPAPRARRRDGSARSHRAIDELVLGDVCRPAVAEDTGRMRRESRRPSHRRSARARRAAGRWRRRPPARARPRASTRHSQLVEPLHDARGAGVSHLPQRR